MPLSELPDVPLKITLFGPLEALVNGQPLPPLRSRKTLWLLALLTLRSNRPVEREWLAGNLWPELDQSRASANLRPILSNLRDKLGSERNRLRSPNRLTVFLDLTGADIDVLKFDIAVTSKQLSELERAVGLYRGPLVEGCTEEWVHHERNVREQNCLQALQTLAEAAFAAKDYTTAAGYYRRAILLDPLGDTYRRGLMESLAKSGDRNAALQVYREFVEFLKSDPKALPDEMTSALYTRLRTEARQKASANAVSPAVTAAKPAVRGYLPHALTDLIGREEEKNEVSACLRRSRLVTLTGPGGIGKTRLALAVAADSVQEYPDGVWLVTLDALSDSRLVLPQIAGVLGIREQSGQTSQESLIDHLRSKQLLLVLDNCERLLEVCAEVIGSLMQVCAELRVLATSREAFCITGETAWAVPSLPVPNLEGLPTESAFLRRFLAGYESIQLFSERAEAFQKSFELTAENALAVAQVCVRLGGLPLAIELAAARVRVMTVKQIAERLDDHLALLTGGSRIAPPRQQTLRATLDWSYAFLSVQEQIVLARLSVFAGGCSLQAVEAICSGAGIAAGQMLDHLTSLVDKSLLTFAVTEVTGEGRYHLLETVQQYAAERLRDDEGSKKTEAEITEEKHSEWFLAFAEEIGFQLTGSAQEACLRQIDLEYANLRVALTRNAAKAGNVDYGMRLTGAIWWFWRTRGRYREGRQYLESALSRAGEQGTPLIRAKALNAAGKLAFSMGDYTEARLLHEESLRLYRQHADTQGAASALNNLGNVAGCISDPAAAKTLYEESLSLYRQAEDKHGIAIALNNLGIQARQQMDYASARALYEECLGLYRSLANLQGVAQTLANLGNLTCLQGDYTTSRSLLEESLRICEGLGDRTNLGYTLSYLGATALWQGDYAAARSTFEKSLSIRRELGEKLSIAWSLSNLGLTALYQDQLLSAQQQFTESLSLFRELGHRTGIAWQLNHLGEVDYRSGNKRAAWAQCMESLTLFYELKDKEGVAENLCDLAALLSGQAQEKSAARLWGAAEALRERIGAPLPPVKQARYAQQVEQACSSLGQEAFIASWKEGRAMTWEQATVHALKP